MALNLSESKELEELKQKHKNQCYGFQEKLTKLEQEQKMARLEKHLELAKLNCHQCTYIFVYPLI